MKTTLFVVKVGIKYLGHSDDNYYYLTSSQCYAHLFDSENDAEATAIYHKIKDYKVYKLEITESIVDISVPEK